MKTPAGSECRYFYGDYYRGRDFEECRLIGNAPPPNHWTRDLCKNCPVPRILMANSCEHMVLEGKVKRLFFGLSRKVELRAYCTRSGENVKEPEVGCSVCHTLPDFIVGK
jgi:hypothetical protein